MANNTGKKFGGREAGTKNRFTSELKTLINDFLNDEFESIKDDFRSLPARDRLFFYDKLLSYCIPKNKEEVEESEPFAEQPLFFEMKSYTIDEKTIKSMPYEDLKQIIEESQIFMESKQGKEYILSLKSPTDINVREEGKKTPTIILNLGSGINPKD